jgi:hypothetical protein
VLFVVGFLVELVASFEKLALTCNDRCSSAELRDHRRTQIKRESKIEKARKA